jgi:hypothetical protein
VSASRVLLAGEEAADGRDMPPSTRDDAERLQRPDDERDKT